MARPKIGKAKYGFTQKKFWKLKDGEQVYGILPPLGDLASDGRWSVYYRVHYGYKNADNKSRPFQSCLEQNRKTKMIEVPDAAVERLDLLKGKLEAAKAAKDEKAKEALFKLYGGQKSIYNLDNNHYMNAIDLQGNIGVLKLRHKAKLALDEEIKKLRKKNIDPLGLENRRYFVFTRSGSGQETTFKVDIYKKPIQVQGLGEVEQEVSHNLSDDILDRLEDEAAKLDRLFKLPSSEEVARIVKESTLTTGVSVNIDEILGMAKEGSTSGQEEINDEPGDEEQQQEVALDQAATPAPAQPVPVAAQPAPAPVQQAPAPMPAPVAAAPAPTPAPAPKAAAPATTTEKLAEMSDKDFLASLGIPS